MVETWEYENDYDEEDDEAIEFYHLKSDCKGGYFRYGRQPIIILPRNDKAESEVRNETDSQ